MKRETRIALTITFESHTQVTEDGIEYWLARDLQYLLGFPEWQEFSAVISLAKAACQASGHPLQEHFFEVGKIVDFGSGDRREIDDILLTRYACYLIAQDGDPQIEAISFAKTYFALLTRKAESMHHQLLGFKNVSTRQKPLQAKNKHLAINYQQTSSNKTFSTIRDKGQRKLFGSAAHRVRSRWKVTDSRLRTDVVPRIILRAVGTSIEITIHNTWQHEHSGTPIITSEHIKNNRVVRESLNQRGTRPLLPATVKDYKSVEKRQNALA